METIQSDRHIILCENCSQQLRLPKITKKLQVSCSECGYKFFYLYRKYWLSSDTMKQLWTGLAGGGLGFLLCEFSMVFLDSQIFAIFRSLLTTAAFCFPLACVLNASNGFIVGDRKRMIYGIKAGIFFGIISGAVSGFIAQIVYGIAMMTFGHQSIGMVILARALGWAVLGGLIGLSFGLKENTIGDMKYGLLGGFIGGFLGGSLFDPVGMFLRFGDGDTGLAARMVGFSLLGIAISISVKGFRDRAIKQGRQEMFRPVTKRLPANPRLSLPDVRK